jgi:hypothetical protein
MRSTCKRFYFAAALLTALLLCCTALPVFAQTTTLGTVNGTVTDSTNAVVPDVSVTLKDTATGQTRTTTTNSAGRYVFINVSPGKYDLTFSKQGFAKSAVTGDVVEVGQVSTNNVILKVGSESQTIEVATTGVELQTDNATVGSTVSGIALQSLPSIARDTSTFLTLQAGISPDGSVAGTVVDQSTFQLDGGNNTNDMDGSMSVYTPSYAGDPTGGVANQSNGVAAGATGVMPTPADSVEEFKVSTAGQGADFNSSSGAQVQVATKRGTGTWHGTVYEYYLDNNLNANTWENNLNGVGNPSFHYNRFGGAIGGPIIPKDILGGKTYFFANYQGFRWPNSTTVEKAVPSDSMRQGLLFFGGQYYNLNPVTVTFKGQNIAPSGLDPRGIGINPLISQLWNKYMPLPNESGCGLSRCDINSAGQGNIGGFLANVGIPQNDNFGVARLDHDFGSKNHFMSSYRYYNLTRATIDQIDIGGLLPGDTLGTPASHSTRPQQPWYLVAGLTTQITNNVTNNFVYSYLRNYWSWSTAGDPPQFPGLAGALEPLGESRDQSLAPYNVNTQQTRTRYWNGHDNMFRDDVSWLKGKHLIQFGGLYQHNWDAHQRTDNGGGINYQTVYQQSTSSRSQINMNGFVPDGVSATSWGRDYAAVLGLTSVSQVAYTRTGKNLTLNPPLTPAQTTVTIPFFNVYGSDTWRMTPRFTLTYGLGWTLEMPPKETKGQQVIFVGPDNNPISTNQYLNSREQAALAGNVFNPQVGFSLIGNLANPRTYPYNPYYGEWSPRVAAAYDMFGDGRTIIRGGYGLTYGRLNGVDLVLVPLLGTGLIQPVQCFGGTNTGSCLGAGSATPVNSFRPGVDGLTAPLPPATQTLPQPLYPGVNGIAAGAGEALDPNFRPNRVQSFTLTFQRQLTNKVSLEVGYIGRLIAHEYLGMNLNAVPYMMTKGGQSFAKAYANTVIGYCGNGDPRNMGGGNCIGNANAVAPQPFFEAALSGTGYCNGYANCTQAVIDKEGVGPNGTGNLGIANVWSLYSDLDNGGFNFPRSMMNTPLNCPTGAEIGCSGQLTSGVGMNASVGHGNYNAMFVSVKTSDWKGVSMQSNFTWSRALGTGAEVQATSEATAIDPFNIDTGYGLQPFDRTLVFNMFAVYQPKWYQSQSGFVGHLLGGWNIAPIFTTGTGLPITLGTINGGGQAFGEGDSVNFFGYGVSENAIPIAQLPTGKRHNNVPGANDIGTSGFGVNMFADPVATWNLVRQPILGYDTKDGGFGVARGLNYWNIDLSVKKMFKISERWSTEFQVVFTNLFNHNQFGDPSGDYLDTSDSGSWGTLPGTVTPTSPRSMEFGVRVSF